MYLTKEAMRYYRLWIYTCNAVLFVSVLVFCIAAIYILSDSRRQLVSSVQLYHPSFLYAYLAIIVQGGVVQVIGCIGALKLHERLLNTYWMLLFCLLIGDIIVGGVWMVRFEHLTSGLAPDLHKRLQTEYASNQGNFRHLFDDLQTESQCCGVENPKDYNATWWQKVEEEYFLDYERGTNHTDEHFLDDFEDDDDNLDREDILLPWSCCIADRLIEEPSAMANKIRGRLLAKNHEETKSSHPDGESVPLFPGSSELAGRRRYYILRKKGTKGFLTPEEKLLFGEEPIFMQGKWCTYSPQGSDWHYHTGCVVPLSEWVNNGADTLFVIGLCVVAFIKFTFLSILRYEIREMIQKIKMMQNETGNMNGELATALGLNSSKALSSTTSSSSSSSPQPTPKVDGIKRSDSRQKVMQPVVANDVRQTAKPPMPTNQQPKAISVSQPPMQHYHPVNNDARNTILVESDKLIDTSEPDIAAHDGHHVTTSVPQPWHTQPQHQLSDLVSGQNDLGSKIFGHEDNSWCTFRPIKPEPTSRDEVSVCMNNFPSSANFAGFTGTGFRGGSSRQTAI